MCAYISYIYMRNEQQMRQDKLFYYYKVLTLPVNGIVLFDNWLGLVVNVY